MKVILYDFVDVWFENQSKFISLHDFDIVLTKAFSFNEFVMIQSILISSESSILSAQKYQKIDV